MLCSFHSISKGFYGECGRRGGYVEMVNTPKDVFAELVKLASIDLCSNLNGQICTALMMQPPQVPHPPFCPSVFLVSTGYLDSDVIIVLL